MVEDGKIVKTITKKMDNEDVKAFEQAVATHKEQKIDRALVVYERLLKKYPDHPRILGMMGVAYGQLNDIAKSIDILKKSHAIFPDDMGTVANLAKAHLEDGQYDESVKYAKMVLEREDSSDTALSNLVDALILAKNMRAATEYSDWYLSKNPNMKKAMSIRAALWEHMGEPELALPYVLNFEDSEGAMSHYCGLSSYLTSMSPEMRFKQHQAWSEKFEEEKNILDFVESYDPNNPRIINIALISSDFRVHSVSYFIRPVLEKMDRSTFRFFCYSYTKQTDHVTQELYELCDEWREIYTLDKDETIQLARQDKIDILIDLNGHTANNRLNVFAKRAAPIQMTWIGYAATTGLKNMDYRLTDELCDPKENAQDYHTEKLIYMQDGFSCYRPAVFSPKVPRAPVKKPFMFGSFNRSTKFNRYTLRRWGKILQQATDAELLIKGNGFEDEYLIERTLSYFKEMDIDPKRIHFEGHEPNAITHLEKFRLAHLSLDSFPYAGTTTTCESLWMGTPLLTLMGTTHAERVSGAILTRMGLEQLVCHSEEEFIERAVYFAKNPETLKNISGAKLRKIFQQSPIMNEEKIITQAADIFVNLMKQHASSSPQKPSLTVKATSNNNKNKIVSASQQMLNQPGNLVGISENNFFGNSFGADTFVTQKTVLEKSKNTSINASVNSPSEKIDDNHDGFKIHKPNIPQDFIAQQQASSKTVIPPDTLEKKQKTEAIKPVVPNDVPKSDQEIYIQQYADTGQQWKAVIPQRKVKKRL